MQALSIKLLGCRVNIAIVSVKVHYYYYHHHQHLKPIFFLNVYVTDCRMLSGEINPSDVIYLLTYLLNDLFHMSIIPLNIFLDILWLMKQFVHPVVLERVLLCLEPATLDRDHYEIEGDMRNIMESFCHVISRINHASESIGKDERFQIFICIGIRYGKHVYLNRLYCFTHIQNTSLQTTVISLPTYSACPTFWPPFI